MRSLRWLCVLLLVAGGAVGVGRATATPDLFPFQAPCDPSALSAHLKGDFRVLSVQNYGCEGRWAFLWATVGPNEVEAIGVTEVMHYDPRRGGWFSALRSTYCHPGRLPQIVYRQGCFSN